MTSLFPGRWKESESSQAVIKKCLQEELDFLVIVGILSTFQGIAYSISIDFKHAINGEGRILLRKMQTSVPTNWSKNSGKRKLILTVGMIHLFQVQYTGHYLDCFLILQDRGTDWFYFCLLPCVLLRYVLFPWQQHFSPQCLFNVWLCKLWGSFCYNMQRRCTLLWLHGGAWSSLPSEYCKFHPSRDEQISPSACYRKWQ